MIQLTENYVVGSKAPLFLEVYDPSNQPMIGLHPTVTLTRLDDGFYWDYQANQFKAPVGNIKAPLIELDLPGRYQRIFDQSIDAVNRVYKAEYFVESPKYGSIEVTMVFGPATINIIPLHIIVRPPKLVTLITKKLP